ncbi:hypothetical protein CFOL_v3_35584 [Cephalotus follicularis]|uniref:Uncharacterized protein n=1 Tax=Cephalotus follicularis TaxID=3775 RepID=A0A1Q3DIR5_CEPFO|nr:hypothetical protein CFOL_v3_35584 [Cephalotus follicularis]
MLVKDNLGIGIILGQPFLEIIKPFKVTNEGITTKLFQQKILFTFKEKPITKEVNLLKTLSIFKEHSINLIKDLSNKKFEQQLPASQIKEKINPLRNNNFCSDLLDAFWHRKRLMVSLPYEKDFAEQNHCKKEIQELLKLIRPSKSPLSYAAFVINYKSLHIVRNPIPNKKYLFKELTKSDSIIHCEWNVVSFDTSRKIMNEIFILYSSFSIMNIDNILTNSKEQHFKYLYQIIQTNDLVLSKTKLDLFITHDRFFGTITYSQKSILFTMTFPDIVTDRKKLPISFFIICIDSLFLNTNKNCQHAFSRLQREKESVKDTLSPTEIKKNTSDTLSPTETKEIMSDTLSFTKIKLRFLQRNKTFEKLLQNIFPFVLQKRESFKITLSPTEIKKKLFKSTLSPTEVKKTLFPTTMKTLSAQKSFTDKLLYHNSNHTHLDPYKKDSFHIHKNSSFHSFVRLPETMETLSSDRSTEYTKK